MMVSSDILREQKALESLALRFSHFANSNHFYNPLQHIHIRATTCSGVGLGGSQGECTTALCHEYSIILIVGLVLVYC